MALLSKKNSPEDVRVKPGRRVRLLNYRAEEYLIAVANLIPFLKKKG